MGRSFCLEMDLVRSAWALGLSRSRRYRLWLRTGQVAFASASSAQVSREVRTEP